MYQRHTAAYSERDGVAVHIQMHFKHFACMCVSLTQQFMPKVRRTHNIRNGASAIAYQFSFHFALLWLFFILIYVTNIIAVSRKAEGERQRQRQSAIYLNQLEDDVNDANERETNRFAIFINCVHNINSNN